MGKVGKEYIQHKNSNNGIEVTINFTAKYKTFTVVGLPDNVLAFFNVQNETQNKEPSDKTYDGLVEKVKKLYNDFLDDDVKEEKIIMYLFEYNKQGKNNLSFAPLTALGLEYKVNYRITIGGKQFYCDSPYLDAKQPDVGIRLGGSRLRSVNNHDDYKRKVILHTEELEKFFESTVNNMETMIDKINNFFGTEPEQLLSNFQQLQLTEGKKDPLV